MTTRTIRVESLARIEGEGSLTIRFKNRKAEQVEFGVLEPPRFFEAFLRGRGRDEVPDIAARICGTSPVAYQLASCKAVERAAGVELTRPILILRHLLICAEWIESHALHTFLLHAPDYLGFADAIEMAQAHPDQVKRGLRLKKLGNTLLRIIGGREVHAVNVALGGFFRLTPAAKLQALLPELASAREDAREALQWMAGFEFPAFERDYTLLAMRSPEGYAMYDGRVVSNRGLDIEVDQFLEHVREVQVDRSTALHALLHDEAYLTGPLARFNLNHDQLSPPAREAARSVGLGAPMMNPFRSLLVRLVEMLHAIDEAVRLIGEYREEGPPHVSLPPCGTDRDATTVAAGCVEAPRGTLFHRFTLDGTGTVRAACIIAPTSQNQASIEGDLRVLGERLIDMPHEQATWLAEQAVRNYDPCLACSTHFLQLRD